MFCGYYLFPFCSKGDLCPNCSDKCNTLGRAFTDGRRPNFRKDDTMSMNNFEELMDIVETIAKDLYISDSDGYRCSKCDGILYPPSQRTGHEDYCVMMKLERLSQKI